MNDVIRLSLLILLVIKLSACRSYQGENQDYNANLGMLHVEAFDLPVSAFLSEESTREILNCSQGKPEVSPKQIHFPQLPETDRGRHVAEKAPEWQKRNQTQHHNHHRTIAEIEFARDPQKDEVSERGAQWCFNGDHKQTSSVGAHI